VASCSWPRLRLNLLLVDTELRRWDVVREIFNCLHRFTSLSTSGADPPTNNSPCLALRVACRPADLAGFSFTDGVTQKISVHVYCKDTAVFAARWSTLACGGDDLHNRFGSVTELTESARLDGMFVYSNVYKTFLCP
jgi:hypothetical protein